MVFGKLLVVTLIFFFFRKINCSTEFWNKNWIVSHFILNGNCVSFLGDFEQCLLPESIFQLLRNQTVCKLTKAMKYSCGEKERTSYKRVLAQRSVWMRCLIKTTFKVRINTKRQRTVLFMRKIKLLTWLPCTLRSN